MSTATYLAIDIETTGLDPKRDRILEVAWAPLTYQLEPLAEVRSRVANYTTSAARRLADNDYVRDMHERSSLLDEWTASRRPLRIIESEILADVASRPWQGQPIIFGSSVHFDKAFIAQHMPRLHAALHYRVFDVSTVLALAGAAASIWLPRDVEPAHRAAADIQWSIDTARRILAEVKRPRRAFEDPESAQGYSRPSAADPDALEEGS